MSGMRGAQRRGWAPKLMAKGVCEMGVAGEAKIKCERGEVARTVGDFIERLTQPQLRELCMQTLAGFLPENTGEMEGRTEDRPRNSIKGDLFSQM
jgi:hypothetical protein